MSPFSCLDQECSVGSPITVTTLLIGASEGRESAGTSRVERAGVRRQPILRDPFPAYADQAYRFTNYSRTLRTDLSFGG